MKNKGKLGFFLARAARKKNLVPPLTKKNFSPPPHFFIIYTMYIDMSTNDYLWVIFLRQWWIFETPVYFLIFQFPISAILPAITLLFYIIVTWKLLLMRKKMEIPNGPNHHIKINMMSKILTVDEKKFRVLFPYQNFENSSILPLLSVYVSMYYFNKFYRIFCVYRFNQNKPSGA